MRKIEIDPIYPNCVQIKVGDVNARVEDVKIDAIGCVSLFKCNSNSGLTLALYTRVGTTMLSYDKTEDDDAKNDHKYIKELIFSQ